MSTTQPLKMPNNQRTCPLAYFFLSLWTMVSLFQSIYRTHGLSYSMQRNWWELIANYTILGYFLKNFVKLFKKCPLLSLSSLLQYRMHACVCSCIYMYEACVGPCIYMSECMCVFVKTCMYVCMSNSMHACLCVFMHACVYNVPNFDFEALWTLSVC